jgi:hypothetical protein
MRFQRHQSLCRSPDLRWVDAAENIAMTSKNELDRVAQAAGTHSWDLSVIPAPIAVMATRESGRVGEPWVVMAVPGGRGLKVSFYRPGDALDAEGEALCDLSGNPREMGRELRTVLEDLADGDAAETEAVG